MIRNQIGRALGLAALAATVAASAAAQTLPPASQIVDKYVAAVGGRSMIGKFSSRHTVAEMNMPAMGMTMTMDVYQARPNKLFSKMNMQGMEITSGYDGTVAWTNNPMTGPRILSGPELNETMTRSSFDANLDMAAQFPTMQTVGERTVAGSPCWDVRMVSASGVEARNCFDKQTGLLVASVSKQRSPQGEMEVEAVFSDYQDYDGLKMPSKTTMSMMGQQVVTTIKSVSHDPVPASTFELPAAVKALQTQPAAAHP